MSELDNKLTFINKVILPADITASLENEISGKIVRTSTMTMFTVDNSHQAYVLDDEDIVKQLKSGDMFKISKEGVVIEETLKSRKLRQTLSSGCRLGARY